MMLAVPLEDTATSWIVYNSEAGNFRINFPGKAMSSVESHGGQTIHLAEFTDSRAYYSASYADVRLDLSKSDFRDSVLSDVRSTLRNTPGFKDVTESPLRLGKYSGSEFRLSNDHGQEMIQRLYFVPYRMYQVISVFPAPRMDDAQAFLSSFSLLQASVIKIPTGWSELVRSNFSVAFPTKPVEGTTKIEADQGTLNFHYFTAETQSASYGMSYVDVPPYPSGKEGMASFFGGFTDAIEKKEGIRAKNISTDGHMGREYRFVAPVALVRTFLVSDRIIQLVVKPKSEQHDEMTLFFGSLRFLD